MFALARVIGSGTIDDPFRADVDKPASALIPSKPDGTPRFNWCLVRLKDPNNTTGTQLFKITETRLDMQVKDINPTLRNNLNTKLTSLGVNTSKIKPTYTIRQVLRYIAKHLDDKADITKSWKV